MAIVLGYNTQSPTIESTHTPDRFAVYLSIVYFPWVNWLLWNSLLPTFTNLLLSMWECWQNFCLLTEFLSPFHCSVEPLWLSCKWLMHEEKLVCVKGNVTVHKPEVFVTMPTPLSQLGNVGYRTLCYFTVENEPAQSIHSWITFLLLFVSYAFSLNSYNWPPSKTELHEPMWLLLCL